VLSQHVDRRTRSERAVAVDISERRGGSPAGVDGVDERAVAVEVSERGLAVPADVDAVEGVRTSGPLHEHRRRRRPGVLDVVEQAILIANYEVQIACERHTNVRSELIGRRTRSERAVVVEIYDGGGALKGAVIVEISEPFRC
jgi:hypothetical protein